MRINILIVTFLAFTSCKNNSQTVEEVKPEPAPEVVVVEPAEDAALPREPAQPDTFRVVVSMISIGEGIDPEGPAKLEKVLNQWERKYGQPANYSVQPWGREGEADYNFTLRGMDRSQQAEFIKLLQAGLQNERLIIVTENKENRFKK